MAFRDPTDPPDWCPGCEPDRDPLSEVLMEKWCYRHEWHAFGADDEAARQALNKRAGIVPRTIVDYSDL